MGKGNKFRGSKNNTRNRKTPVPQKHPKVETPKTKYGRSDRRKKKVNLRNINLDEDDE